MSVTHILIIVLMIIITTWSTVTGDDILVLDLSLGLGFVTLIISVKSLMTPLTDQ